MKEITRESCVKISLGIVANAIDREVMSEETAVLIRSVLDKEVKSNKPLEEMPLHECFYAFSLLESFIDLATSSKGNVLSINFDNIIDDGEVSVELFVDSVKEIIASLVGLITNAISYLGCDPENEIIIPSEIIVLKEISIKLQKHDFPICNAIPFLLRLNVLVQSDIGAREMSRLCSPSASHVMGQNVFTTPRYMDSVVYDKFGKASIDGSHHFGVTRKLVERMHTKGVRSINKASKFLKHMKEVLSVSD